MGYREPISSTSVSIDRKLCIHIVDVFGMTKFYMKSISSFLLKSQKPCKFSAIRNIYYGIVLKI